MWKTVYKKVDKDWHISVTHFIYGQDLKNDYSVFIRYKNNDWLWNDVKYSRNQLSSEIIKMKKGILLNKRLKPCRISKSR